MKHQAWIALIAAAAALSGLSANAESLGVAVISTDGSVSSVEIEKIERIDILPEAIKIVQTGGEENSYSINDINRIDIGVKVTPSGIQQITNEGNIAVWPTAVTSTLNISGAKSDTPVQVFNAAGQCVANAKTTADTTLSLDLSNLPTGPYIVTVADKSIKIIKK